MHRTTLSTPSSDEVTMTGRSRSCRSRVSCSSTWKPFISGISISSSSKSNGSRLSISSAMRPFAAAVTRCPINSMLRDSSRRLTLLSSTTSSRAPPWLASRTLELPQRFGHARVFAGELRERRAVRLARDRKAAELQLFRHRPERKSAEGIAVRLERMRNPAEPLRVVRRERTVQLFEHPRRFDEECVDQIADEVGAGGFLEVREGGAIDDGFAHGRLAREGTRLR